jgi:hypothetical protein
MKQLTSILFLMLFCTACTKDNLDEYENLELPEITQSGQHTFGFLLNDDVWVNFGERCSVVPAQCRENLKGFFFESDGDIQISADRVLRDNNQFVSSTSLIIYLKTDFRGLGSYSTALGDLLNVNYLVTEDSIYILPENNPNFVVNITRLDLDAKILSGEFSGTLFHRDNLSNQSTSPTDSIRIEDGRFDIRLK